MAEHLLGDLQGEGMGLAPTPAADLARALSPELTLTAAGMLALLVTAWRHTSARDLRIVGWVTLAGLAAGGAAGWWVWAPSAPAAGPPSMIAGDAFPLGPGAPLLAA